MMAPAEQVLRTHTFATALTRTDATLPNTILEGGTVVRVGPLALFAIALLLGCARSTVPRMARPEPPLPMAGTPQLAAISEESLRAHVRFLASDALNGRGSGTRDEHIAAEYVASHFRRLNLRPVDDSETYVQLIEIQETTGAGPPSPVLGDQARSLTYNAVGILPGLDTRQSGEAIVLFAHIDHLGRRASSAGQDTIFNGADDNASGVAAVLSLAEALATGPPLMRNVIFACFGSEENGGYGSQSFVEQPPIPLHRIVAGIGFEMLGRPDPTMPPHTAWLTGFDRSNLGPLLVVRGARLLADPRPEQQFFRRSDNSAFVRASVVAHVVSTFGLHEHYHTPSDEVGRIDFSHMLQVIRSLAPAIAWLANSDVRPSWTGRGR